MEKFVKNNIFFYVVGWIKNLLSPLRVLEGKVNGTTVEMLSRVVQSGGVWLDVGCGLKPFYSSFGNAEYVGIDIKVSGRPASMKDPDKFFDGVNIPYPNNFFDGLLCTQVLEHVENLDELLVNFHKVLKKNGELVISLPFIYREHEQPFDFRRFTSFGINAVLTSRGFEVKECIKCLSALETIATLLAVYISNNIGSRGKLFNMLTSTLIYFPILLLSQALSHFLPDNHDLYSALVVRAVKN
jgi:SAM-dependent methyltransferase